MSSAAHCRLRRLQAERLMAREAGIDPASTYFTRLEAAIAGARAEVVTGFVVEIAALRAAFDGRLKG